VFLLACLDVLAANCQRSGMEPGNARNAYPILGQFFNCVPSKTSQSLLLTEKSISGAPPGPLTIILKAIGITCAHALAHSLEVFPVLPGLVLHQCPHLNAHVSLIDRVYIP
jgi:hypothetical protein